MQSLQARGLVRRYGDRVVLDGIDLVASPGQRIGLIGENGAGKSTLLRLLAGADRPDAGSVDRPGDLVYLPQDPVFSPGMTVGGVLAEALAPLHAAVDRLERLAGALGDSPGLAASYAQALDWAQLHDAWDADRRAELTGQQLGLATIDAQHPVAALSGGQRARLRLAALITRRPDCVLLDEPTNHLDDDAMAMLEDFLVSIPGVVVAASHDRTFLDRVCTHLVDLDPAELGTDGRGGRRFGGGWSAYVQHRAEARRRWEQAYAEQQDELSRLRQQSTGTARQVAHNRPPRDNDKFITHFKGAGVQRTVARRVRDVERRLDAAERAQVRKPREPLRLHAEAVATSTAAGGVAVSVRHLRVPGRVALDVLDVVTGEHLLVSGGNGSGKSSLLRVLAGDLAPAEGTVHVRARRLAMLGQDTTFADESVTAGQTYAAHAATLRSTPPTLGSLGLLHPRDIGRPVGTLSTGQRRRLELALVLAHSPDLLLLDEPTNHLSPTLVTELTEALATTAGTVVVASHDRWLRRCWQGPQVRLSPYAP